MNNIREWIPAGRPVEQPLLRTRKPRPHAAPSRAAEDESFADVSIRREGIRQANHRGAARHRLDNEVAELVHEGRRQTCTLVNLSGGESAVRFQVFCDEFTIVWAAGTGIHSTYEWMHQQLAPAEAFERAQADRALVALTRNVDTRGAQAGERTVVVWNALSFPRDDVMRVSVPNASQYRSPW